MGRRVNRPRRLSRAQESALHQEILAVYDAQHQKQLSWIETKVWFQKQAAIYAEERLTSLCSEWGRT